MALLTEEGVEKEKAVVFAECLSARDLTEESFKDLSASISYQTLQDFEWNLKVRTYSRNSLRQSTKDPQNQFLLSDVLIRIHLI